MCVLAFAWRAHPRWHLVAAGNRDELHARPAAPLGRWDDGSGIIAGRDLQSGGSWMGVSEQGRFAVVTNLRGYGPPQPKRVSRGALVSDPLAGRGRFAELRTDELAAFNPFNLIVADGDRADFLTNRPEPLRRRLEPGVYGLSNGPLDAPWPKTLRLKEGLSAWLDEPHAGTEALLALLRDDSLPADATEIAPSDVPDEPPLSSIFIRHPLYGTRCSTVVAVDDQGEGLIVERQYRGDGEADGDTSLAFRWDI
ncbi:NRDE family protein [Sphingosinicella sp. CPCC 101087]|uniref:NRDE family protein n=1 Tax=Sphingosinicella sp. CPCC 101087 TaxID=2497754 RepID=UPI00101B91BD|nr:NRDE family protein [Sphingosinicella sp. CPCC 101087]